MKTLAAMAGCFLVSTALLACSAQEITPPPGAGPTSYRYHHLETTGLTDEILLVDGTRQRIQLAPESSQADRGALSSLLTCGIFGTLRTLPTSQREPGSDGAAFEQRLFLVGELRSPVLRTPDGPDRAMPEDYRELVLHTWYLEAPFSVLDGFGTADSEWLGREETSLQRACPTLAASGDPDHFVRAHEERR